MQALVDSLNKQVEQHIHGPGRERILSLLQRNPTADAVASITYEMIMDMDQQAVENAAPLGMDIILAVATETIDMILEIMEAMGTQINPDEMRNESLLKIALLHMQQVEQGGDPQEIEAAKAMLSALGESGMVGEAMNHINSKADARPEQMQAAGMQMIAPKQNPMAAGVQQGLMQG